MWRDELVLADQVVRHSVRVPQVGGAKEGQIDIKKSEIMGLKRREGERERERGRESR